MNKINLIDSFSEFKEFKNINRPTMMNILEDIFRTMIVKKYGTDENFDIIINIDKGDLELWRNRLVVDDEFAEDSFDYDENKHISLSDAIKIDTDFTIGEEVTEPVNMNDFGRRAILTLKQGLMSRVLDLEKENTLDKYKDRIGDLISGEVYKINKNEISIMDDDGIELILPKSGQIPREFYKKGEIIKAVIENVEMVKNSPLITISRSSSEFLERLLELEIPEILDGLITINKIVREAGERSKVSVESFDERIDPVGACVGVKGSRLREIFKELRNENIDIINYTKNIELYITRALNPAKIKNIKIDEDKKSAEIFLDTDQIAKAIGKGGHNIKLSSKLTGYSIDIYQENIKYEDDVNLDEFTDEIDEWVINILKSIGCDTAKSVLELSTEDLLKRTDLEEETIKDVKLILTEEFE